MATRDPNLISEHFIPIDGAVAIVKESAGEKENVYYLVNKGDIPDHLQKEVIETAKKYESKK